MVYRRLIIFTITFTAVLAAHAGQPVREIDKDIIREDADREIMRTPPQAEIEPDLAAIRVLFRHPVTSGYVASPDARQTPPMQVVTGSSDLTVEQALTLIADTIGYQIERNGVGYMNQSIHLPQQEVTVEQLLGVVEKTANVRLAVYPVSAMILIHRD
jgi:hypothetical protein